VVTVLCSPGIGHHGDLWQHGLWLDGAKGRFFFLVAGCLSFHTLFNIAMEHGPFIDGLPIKNGDFPWLC